MWAGLCAGPVFSQTIEVFSEFHRVDPFGKPVAADAGNPQSAPSPREILSPALVRNGFTSLRIAVTVPQNRNYRLFVVQNPEAALRMQLYRERYTKRGPAWVADQLEPVELTYHGRMPDPATGIEGQTTETFWLDLWAVPKAQVRRIRVEAQLSVGDHWVIYPMEVRVISTEAPNVHFLGGGGTASPVQAGSDTFASGLLRDFLCGAPEKRLAAGPPSVRRFIYRNAQQDMSIARALETNGDAGVRGALLEIAGAGDREKWCQSPVFPQGAGAEWYLKVRDYLYRAGEAKGAGPRRQTGPGSRDRVVH